MSADKPWYQYKRVWIIRLLALIVCLVVWVYYQFYRPIEVTRGPWQVLDPGQPVDNPLKFEVVQEGTGSVVEPGDLIQISLQTRSAQWRDYDFTADWWIWVGFRTKDETPFYAMNLRLLSALVGQKEGGGVIFLESPRRDQSAGTVYINPFGSYNYYAGKKNGYSNSSMPIFIPTNSGHMDVYIKKIFKGQLKYRTVHLYDDTWIHFCGSWFYCDYINTPREGWVDEARFDGVSNDGKRATFQYGPLNTPGKEWYGPGSTAVNGYQPWIKDEWRKLPVGVQVE
jgi:hypothetical protein